MYNYLDIKLQLLLWEVCSYVRLSMYYYGFVVDSRRRKIQVLSIQPSWP